MDQILNASDSDLDDEEPVNSVFARRVSPELCDFLGHDRGTAMTRADVVRLRFGYETRFCDLTLRLVTGPRNLPHDPGTGAEPHHR